MKMTKNLEKTVSLLTIVKKLKHKDCAYFFEHLNDQGIELLCKVFHYILNGELRLSDQVKGRLRKKIQAQLGKFRQLATPPKRFSDIRKKRHILQRGGILGILTAIASSVVPLIAQLIASRISRQKRRSVK